MLAAEKQQREPTLARIARLIGLLFGGIFAGFLTTVLVLELSMRDQVGSVYAQVRQIELIGLDVLATVTLLPALLATAILVVATFRKKGAARWLPSFALVLFVGVLILTVVVNLPINADQRDWIVSMPPPDWVTVRDRWQVSHAVRTVAAVIAFCCLSVAALDRRQSSVDRRAADME
ncbi:anthrone oxygenase family protein [Nocardia sp. NPDC004278]